MYIVIIFQIDKNEYQVYNFYLPEARKQYFVKIISQKNNINIKPSIMIIFLLALSCNM